MKRYGAAMKVTCWNSKCKHYWENMCTREADGTNLIHLDDKGKCKDFEVGESDWYKREENV